MSMVVSSTELRHRVSESKLAQPEESLKAWFRLAGKCNFCGEITIERGSGMPRVEVLDGRHSLLFVCPGGCKHPRKRIDEVIEDKIAPLLPIRKRRRHG